MNTFTIVGLIVVGTIYFFISQYYLKRKLKIRDKWVLTRNRNAYSLAVEILLFIVFTYSFFALNLSEDSHTYTATTKIVPVFALFFLLSITRGMDEWLRNRDEKVYYHDWLGSTLIALSFLVLYIGEQY